MDAKRINNIFFLFLGGVGFLISVLGPSAVVGCLIASLICVLWGSAIVDSLMTVLKDESFRAFLNSSQL